MNPHIDELEMGTPKPAKLSGPQAERRPLRARECTRRTRNVICICQEPGRIASRSRSAAKKRAVSRSRCWPWSRKRPEAPVVADTSEFITVSKTPKDVIKSTVGEDI
ncbi:Uncharacterised protein [Mycobacteroides abscessus subsp. massiliense]|nr:Uncharacterised protein [Mycobacteroides abscessus subsp. massiliense]